MDLLSTECLTPRKTASFVSLRSSVFPLAWPPERFAQKIKGKQNPLFPTDPVIKRGRQNISRIENQ